MILDASYHNDLGVKYFRSGYYEEAIREFKWAVEFDRNNPGYHGNLARAYAESGQYEDAIREYKQAVRLDPDNPVHLSSLARAYIDSGQYEKAIIELERLNQICPNVPEYHYMLGMLYGNLGNSESAINEVTKAAKLDKCNPMYPNQLGLAYACSGRYKEAVNWYERAVELDGHNPEYRNGLGDAYAMCGRYEEAIRELKRAIDYENDNPEYYNDLGLAYYNSRLYREAIQEFNHAIDLDGRNPVYHDNLGKAYFNAKCYEESISEHRKAVGFDSRNSAYRNNLGKSYYNAGRYDEAIDELKWAVELESDNPKYHNDLGRAYFNVRQYEEAILEQRHAVELDGHNPAYRGCLGEAYAMSGLYEEAITEFKHAIKLESDNPKCHANLGLAYAEIGQDEEGISQIEQAIELGGRDPVYYRELGGLYSKAERYEEAIVIFREAQELGMHSIHIEIGEIYEQRYRDRRQAYREYQAALRDVRDIITKMRAQVKILELHQNLSLQTIKKIDPELRGQFKKLLNQEAEISLHEPYGISSLRSEWEALKHYDFTQITELLTQLDTLSEQELVINPHNVTGGYGQMISIAPILYQLAIVTRNLLRLSARMLFNTSSYFAGDLDKNELPLGLQMVFNKNGCPLTQDARVAIDETGRRWIITDKNREYFAIKSENRLNIWIVQDFYKHKGFEDVLTTIQNKTIEEYQKVIDHYQAQSNKVGAARMKIDLGHLYAEFSISDIHALTLYDEALDTYTNIGNDYYQAYILYLKIYPLGRQGLVKKVMECFQKAMHIAISYNIKPLEYSLHAAMATVHVRDGNRDAAIQSLKSAISIEEANRTTALDWEDISFGYTNIGYLYDDLIGLYVSDGYESDGATTKELLQCLEHSINRSLINSLRLRILAPEHLAEIYDNFLSVKKQFERVDRQFKAKLLNPKFKAERLKSIQNLKERLREQVTKRQQLIEADPEGQEFAALAWGDLQTAEEMLEFLHKEYPDSGIVEYYYSRENNSCFALVIPPMGEPECIMLEQPAEVILQKTAIFREALALEKTAFGKHTASEESRSATGIQNDPYLSLDIDYNEKLSRYQEMSEDVYAILFSKIRDRLNTDKLIFIGHRDWYNLDFHALYDGSEYLAQNYHISYAPSISTLIYASRIRPLEIGRTLVMGHPDGEHDNALSAASSFTEYLSLLYNTDPLVKQKATKANLTKYLPLANSAWIIAHADFCPREPMESAIILCKAGESGYVTDRITSQALLDTRMRLRLNLLVLLSCRASYGAYVESMGNELLGISRAFIQLGTCSLLAPSWRIHVEASTKFLERFAEHYKEHGSKTEALQQAQKLFIENPPTPCYQYPFFWAPYRLVGIPH